MWKCDIYQIHSRFSQIPKSSILSKAHHSKLRGQSLREEDKDEKEVTEPEEVNFLSPKENLIPRNFRADHLPNVDNL